MTARFMLRDPSLWEEPEVYSPDRFLVPAPAGRPDPSISFGYGRRLVLSLLLNPQSTLTDVSFLVTALANILLKK